MKTETGKKTILALFNTSWGEVDWLLPVLHEARTNRGARVFSFFMREKTFQGRSGHRDLWQALVKISEKVMSPSSLPPVREGFKGSLRDRALEFFSRRRPRRMAGPWLGSRDAVFAHRLKSVMPAPDYIFREHDDYDFGPYTAAFPRGREVVYPHSTFWHGAWLDCARVWGGRAAEEITGVSYEYISPRSVVLAGREEDVPYWQEKFPQSLVLGLGHPKLDPCWARELRDISGGGAVEKRQRPLTVLICEAKPKNIIGYDEIVHGIFTALEKHGARLLIKGYPRLKSSPLMEAAENYPGVPSALTQDSITGSAFKADFSISFCHSTSGMDAVNAGIPAVEMFHCLEQTEQFFHRGSVPAYHWYKEIQETFSRAGVAKLIKSPGEFMAFVERAAAEPDYLAGLWRAQDRALSASLPKREGSATLLWDRLESV